MTYSSLVFLEAGSLSWPQLVRLAISFLVATLLALEVRWIQSPAQMLAPSTVVRSCGEDSPEPKKLRMLISLAFPAAASDKLFSAQRNSAAYSAERRCAANLLTLLNLLKGKSRP